MTHHNLYLVDDQGKSEHTWLLDGKPGGFQAMYKIRNVSRAALGQDGHTRDERLYKLATDILSAARVSSHDDHAAVVAIHNHIIERVSYIQDPTGGDESIEHPYFTYFTRGWGDCDALVTLEIVLLGMIGYECVIEAAQYDRGIDGFQHVYLDVNLGGEWMYLDPTASDKPAGWHEEDAVGVARLSVNDADAQIELGGFLSFLGDVVAPAVGAAFGVPVPPLHVGHGDPARPAQVKFDEAAKETTALFASINAKGDAITVDDFNAAEAAYNYLAEIARTTPTPQIQEWWNSPDYNAAYRSQLQKMAERLAAKQVTATAGSGGATTPVGSSGVIDTAIANATAGVDLTRVAMIAAAAFLVGKIF